VEIKHVSRWLNGIAMTQMNESLFQQVLELNFTDTIPWEPETDDVYFPPKSGIPRFDGPVEPAPAYDYGIAREQVRQVRTDGLHQLGYTGRGVWIGVLDAGFYNMDSLPSFSRLYEEERILGERNYVNESSIYELTSSHGMAVSSIMAGLWDANLVGTAPHAHYLLCSTENSDQETRLEEIAWIEAAEYADSLGVDVLNTSLGYSDFDGNEFDYSYRDMDGRSTYISRAASLCASRGMILCTSAGNSGNDDWFHITAPADASNVLAVGAVDSTNVLANFSSRGPSYDARIKPDITAMGYRTGIQYRDGRLLRGNGTSFSSPVMAGSVASLWQAFPNLPARDLIHMVRHSGHRSLNPDSMFGFGTPNMMYAYHSITRTPFSMKEGALEIWPNPARDRIRIRIPEEGQQMVRLYDLNGRMALSRSMDLPGEMNLPPGLPQGIYVLEVRTGAGVYHSRLVIQ
jgi:subtilisin family serine protease